MQILDCAAKGTEQAALLEAALTRDLSHPNIVQTLDVAIRMEEVRGRSVWVVFWNYLP